MHRIVLRPPFCMVIIKPVKFLKNLPLFQKQNFQLKGTAIKLGLKWRCRCQWLWRVASRGYRTIVAITRSSVGAAAHEPGGGGIDVQ